MRTTPLGTITGIMLCLNVARGVTFQIDDPVEFERINDTSAVLVTNATINTWLEGPARVPITSTNGYLVFCDQGYNRLRKTEQLTPAIWLDSTNPVSTTNGLNAVYVDTTHSARFFRFGFSRGPWAD